METAGSLQGWVVWVTLIDILGFWFFSHLAMDKMTRTAACSRKKRGRTNLCYKVMTGPFLFELGTGCMRYFGCLLESFRSCSRMVLCDGAEGCF